MNLKYINFNIIYKKRFWIYIILLFIVINSEILYPDILVVGGYDTPAFRSFLTSSTLGHTPQVIIKWYLSIHILLLCVEDTILEVKNRSHYNIIARIGHKKYILQTIKKNVVITIIVFGSLLSVNFLLNVLLHHNATISEVWYSEALNPQNPNYTTYTNFQFTYQNITYILYIIAFLVISGLIAMLATLVSMVVKDEKIVYPLMFIVYFYFEQSNSLGIYGIMQPFTEHSFRHDFIPFLIFSCMYLSSSLVLYKVARSRYERSI